MLSLVTESFQKRNLAQEAASLANPLCLMLGSRGLYIAEHNPDNEDKIMDVFGATMSGR